MRREHLEHVIAAAAQVTGEAEIVVVGSQAILGSFPDPPAALAASMEADVYPLRRPLLAEAIDASLGDGSQFHRTFGYYAHGVGPETVKAPSGWQQRLVKLPVPARSARQRDAVALCLEPPDLVLAKAVAGRERDWSYVETALAAGVVDRERLRAGIAELPLGRSDRDHVGAMLTRLERR